MVTGQWIAYKMHPYKFVRKIVVFSVLLCFFVSLLESFCYGARPTTSTDVFRVGGKTVEKSILYKNQYLHVRTYQFFNAPELHMNSS